MDAKKRFPFRVLAGSLLVGMLVWSVSAPARPAQKGGEAATLLEEAEGLIKEGDFAKAEGILRRLLDKHKGSEHTKTARYRLGDTIFFREDLPAKERSSAAIEAYKEALRSDPQNPLAEWALLQTAKAYRLQRKPFLAATFYQRLMREHPEGRFFSEALFGRAEAYYSISQFSLSNELFSAFAEKYPRDEKVLRALAGAANSLYRLEKYDEAVEAYRRLASHPAFSPAVLEPEDRYSMAETCFRVKDFGCAKDLFMQYYNLYPESDRSDEALARLGDVHAETGQPSTALSFYQEVVSRYPDSDGAAISKIRMADLAISHKEVSKTLAVMEPDFDLLKTYNSVADSEVSRPLSELALYKKAQFLSSQGHHLEAIEEFRRLRSRYPSGNLVEHSRAAALEVLQKVVEKKLSEKEGFKAIELFLAHQALTVNSDYQPYALYCLVGEAYMEMGMADRAVKLLKKVVEVEFPTPQDEQASWLLGKAYVEAGEAESAAKQVREFLGRYPKSPYAREARFTLGKALFMQKRYTEALGLLEAEADRQDAAAYSSEALLLYARTLRGLARPEEAALAYDKLLSIKVKDDKVLERSRQEAAYELADLRFAQGDLKKAVTSYEEAIKLYPEDPRRQWAELQIGRALQGLGKDAEAREAYKSLAAGESESIWSAVAAEYGAAIRKER